MIILKYQLSIIIINNYLEEFMRVVFCTTPLDESEKIAKALVKEQIVACVNIIPKIQSHYSWKGELCMDEESLLIMKTKHELVPMVIERINQLHSYDVPEIIAMEIKEGDDKYLSWIGEVTKAV